MKKLRSIGVLLASFWCLGILKVDAAKLFALNVTWNNGADQVFAENSSFPDLIHSFVDQSDDFSGISGDVYEGSLRYYGLPDALHIALDLNQYTLHVTSQITGLDVTLEGVDEEDLTRKFVDWMAGDGSSASSEFLREIIKFSAATITDGNPGSTTALLAGNTFQSFGLFQGSARGQTTRGFESGAHIGFWVSSSAYEINTPVGKMEGERTRIDIPVWFHFGSRVSLVSNTTFDYNSLEGTEFYGFGTDLGFAFRPVLRSGEDRFGWQVTPFVGGYGLGSYDGVTAAVLGQYGLLNRFEWRVFDRSLVSVVSQYTSFKNMDVKVSDYSLTTPIEQNILKNGIMFDAPVFSLQSLYANLYVIDTRFLEDAKTDNFQTLGGGLSFRLQKFGVNAYVEGDYTDDYQGLNAGLGLVWDI